MKTYAKAIEYAYPSSPIAVSAGFGQIGCWFVGLYPSVTSTIGRLKILHHALTKEKAKEFADTQPYPYSHMHEKYFLQKNNYSRNRNRN